MDANKAFKAIGIFVIVYFFLAAPSFAIMAVSDPNQVEELSIEEQVDNACPCDGWKNHGEYVKCVSQKVKELYQDGSVTEEDGAAIISARAKRDCGKKK